MDKKSLGMTLAAAAAFAIVSAPMTSTLAQAESKEVPCYGVNGCKGQSTCKTAMSECKGTNSCKGKGVLLKTTEQCKAMGGSLEAPKAEPKK
jgi:uncharacterized membrane protein